MEQFGTFVFFFMLIAFSIWYEVAIWNECLMTNSWWYCLRILSP
jgi:hypothetical protein